MKLRKVRVGIIGCGAISGAYLAAAGGQFEILEVAACADLVAQRAKAAAKVIRDNGWGRPVACTAEKLLKIQDIEIVLNLTVPKAHFSVAMRTVEAGRHVHNEKPLCLTREEGQRLLAAASRRKVRVGCAPDTFLGGGHQTARKLIDDGAIGRPVAATAFMMSHGPESWHPSPEFYFKKGGGPMFDMGPYYLTDLVQLLGPIRTVAGMAKRSFATRTITSKPKYGKKVRVQVPTHVAGTMEFESGAIGTMVMSFDVWGHHCPRIEVHGTDGSMVVPDPNRFSEPVLLRGTGRNAEWAEVPLTHGYNGRHRGIGAADIAYAIQTNRPHRCSGELAYHVLEAMWAFHDSSDAGRAYRMKSTCRRPAPLPTGLPEGKLDP